MKSPGLLNRPRMNSQPRSSPILLLCYLTLFAHGALGQSLSILRNSPSNFWIRAAAPVDTRYVLQESVNLHLWVDLNDQVSGHSSNRFDTTGVAKRFFRLTPWKLPAPPITVVLLGDSTAADLTNNLYMVNGWGQGIYGYFKSNVRVVNLAYPGYSTKRFLGSDEKAKMVAIGPDFVLVQLGLDDEFALRLGEPQATTLEEYAANLTTIVQLIRGFNGTPILITPPVQGFFDGTGKVVPLYEDRWKVERDVAAELQTPLIDLNQLSMDLFNKLGKSGSDSILLEDDLHFTDRGAEVIAGLVVNALPDSLGPYLQGIFHPPPAP